MMMVIEKIIDRICGILIHFWNNTEHQQNFKFYSRMKRVYLLAPKLEWKIVPNEYCAYGNDTFRIENVIIEHVILAKITLKQA